MARRCTASLKACKTPDRELSRLTGANYFAIRRMRDKGVGSQTKNAKLLCKFFAISGKDEVGSRTELPDLHRIIDTTWDGTPSHAKLIASLIRSTAPFEISSKVHAGRTRKKR